MTLPGPPPDFQATPGGTVRPANGGWPPLAGPGSVRADQTSALWARVVTVSSPSPLARVAAYE